LLADKKLSTPLTEFPVNIQGIFRDSYVFEFFDLPDGHPENDLRHALLRYLKKIL
jgi:predicted nuclease of restriction endonuclease-like (RecB) superfamily